MFPFCSVKEFIIELTLNGPAPIANWLLKIVWNWGDMCIMVGLHAMGTLPECCKDWPTYTPIQLHHFWTASPSYSFLVTTKTGDPNTWKLSSFQWTFCKGIDSCCSLLMHFEKYMRDVPQRARILLSPPSAISPLYAVKVFWQCWSSYQCGILPTHFACAQLQHSILVFFVVCAWLLEAGGCIYPIMDFK